MPQLDDAFLDQLEEYGRIARTLSMCLRPTFCAEHEDTTLVWGDWSSIEARILPWLADNSGGREVLEVFKRVDANPEAADIYMIEASNIHGVDAQEINGRILDGKKKQYANNTAIQTAAAEAKGWRQEGKVASLALGFGGSVGALMAMATGYGLHFEEDRAQRIVDIWRDNNRWAKSFWDALKEAFFGAYQNPGLIYTAGRVAYIYDPDYHGGTVFCALPDARLLSYPNLKYREVERTDRKTGDVYTQKVLTYRKGYKWGSIWHGILAENPTQAVAASVLRAKLRQLDHAGQAFWAEEGKSGVQHWEQMNNSRLTVDRARYEMLYGIEIPECQLDSRFHTHDEIGVECYADEADYVTRYLKRVMDAPLPWSDGLPLVSEMTASVWYTKSLD